MARAFRWLSFWSLTRTRTPRDPPDVEAPPAGHLVVTLHGIRTFGQWQERLSHLLRTAEPGIEVRNYRYGYFSSIGFMVPFLRWIQIRRFRRALRNDVAQQRWSRIDIVAHSFGTHLAAWALHGMAPDERPHVHTVILAGSVLKPGFPWGDLFNHVGRVVNDCGTRDSILVLNQLAVLFTGMAGRIGFHGMTGRRFSNRYFAFGHSGYFVTAGTPIDDHMRTYWLPLLTSEADAIDVDQRDALGPLGGLATFALNNAEPIKLAAYVTPLVVALVWIYGLYSSADEQRRLALARLISAEAMLAAEDPNPTNGDVSRAVLLGAHALRVVDLPELRGNLLRILQRTHRLYAHYWGHTYDITGVAISPDGRTIASGSWDHTVRLWDAVSGEALGEPLRQDDAVTSVAFNPEGTLMLVGTWKNTVSFWDIDSRARMGDPLKGGSDTVAPEDERFRPDGRASTTPLIVGVAFGAGGTIAASASSDGSIVVWDAKTRTPRLTFRPTDPGAVASLAVSADERLIAVGLWDGRVIVSDATSGASKLSLRAHNRQVASIAFHPSAPILASAGEDGAIHFWPLSGGTEPARTLRHHRGAIRTLRFQRNGQRLFSAGDDGQIVVWDISRGAFVIESLRGHTWPISSIAASQDGQWLVSGGADRAVVLWSFREAQPLGYALNGHTDDITAIASDGAGRIATGGKGGHVAVWDANRLAPIKPPIALHEREVEDVALAPSGDRVLSVSQDRLVAWDFARDVRSVVSVPDEVKDIAGVTFNWNARFSQSTDLLALGRGREVTLWNWRTGKISQLPVRHTDQVFSLEFGAGDRLLLSGSRDLSAMLWDLATRSVLRRYAPHDNSVLDSSFSPDGTTVATVDYDGDVHLWDVATGASRAILPDVGEEGSKAGGHLAFSDDGNVVASIGSATGYKTGVVLLDARNLSQVGPPITTERVLQAIAFVGGGRWLATAGWSGHLMLWDVDLLRRACRIAGRNLTSAEWARYFGATTVESTCPR